jgi:hypothetical protein
MRTQAQILKKEHDNFIHLQSSLSILNFFMVYIETILISKEGLQIPFIFFLLNPSKHNTNEICIITFNGALLHVSASGSHHQAKYNKPILNY